MKNLDNLSEDTVCLFLLSKTISLNCKEDSISLNHLLLAFSMIESPVKCFFEKFDINSEYINEKLFNSSIDLKELLNTKVSTTTDGLVLLLEQRVVFCLDSAIRENSKNNTLVFPEDLFVYILKSNDVSIKKTIALLFKDVVKPQDILSFIKSSCSNVKGIEDYTDKFRSPLRPLRPVNGRPTNALLAYGTNLNKKARDGKIYPICGRDKELNRIIEILGRKDKNNPCLIGEPGVGKTAIVEELALRILENNVPNFLKRQTIISLDVGALLSGAKYRGDFEERIKSIIDEVTANSNIILFIDEIHNIVSAGSSEGSINCANLLKPYLARGEIKCIGATTFSEYKKYIESDSALSRRLQKIQIDEPSEESCLFMLERAKSSYEKYHGVVIQDDALEAAVRLSSRYIPEKYLPDKAFDLIDEACSRKKLLSDEECVTKVDIAEILYRNTGIPVNDMIAETSQKVLDLQNTLHSKIIGQEEAITSISKAIIRSSAGLKDINKPIASFVFDGPTGVGKTYLAKLLASSMFGNEDSIIRIDMSEYMEKYSVSKLIGTAPGYVGFGEGGQLTEAVKRKPYSVVLFDEIEKAHPDVTNIFLQILDYGAITDGEGRKIDFRNTIIIFTSNLYNPYSKKSRPIGFPGANLGKIDMNYKEEAIKSFEENFSPEFVNRLDDVIVFNQLNKESLLKILDLLLNDLKLKLKEKDIKLSINKKSKEFILSKCDSDKYGARQLKRLISTYIEDELSLMLLSKRLNSGDKLKITTSSKGLSFNIPKELNNNQSYCIKEIQNV